MNQRHPRVPTRSQGALIHRGPQAVSGAAHTITGPLHAPNAALLIDFDNVTMGIRSDLGKELRNLLSTDIIKGKVAVQRAYADWRRYPQYIVPLTEASIDLIYAPAYGSSKKNATDIRLAIDAMELVFTRPEIGTIILLSGDSDFSSLVIKLKEYGKYVIGVGIRESSSDLLVMNCDEYYSYNALAGLTKTSDEEPTRKWDPWELVSEAVGRMKRNGDVMRSDRLKQVMQEIDATFDEKDLGMSKFSRFVQDASGRGLITITKLENGQLEIDAPSSAPAAGEATMRTPAEGAPAIAEETREGREARDGRRGRRGGRGRGRDREGRADAPRADSLRPQPQADGASAPVSPAAAAPVPATAAAPTPAPTVSRIHAKPAEPGAEGERLTRTEAFDLLRRVVADLAPGESLRASALRTRARELLGRDSESLSERMFVRILKDGHDTGVVDLRRRGDDFEVTRAAEADTVANQVAKAEQAAIAASAPPPPPPGPRLGMGPRGAGAKGRGRELPPGLLTVGVVAPKTPTPVPASPPATASTEDGAKPKGRGRAKPVAEKKGKAPESPAAVAEPTPKPKAKRGKPAAKGGGGGGRKKAVGTEA